MQSYKTDLGGTLHQPRLHCAARGQGCRIPGFVKEKSTVSLLHFCCQSGGIATTVHTSISVVDDVEYN